MSKKKSKSRRNLKRRERREALRSPMPRFVPQVEFPKDVILQAAEYARTVRPNVTGHEIFTEFVQTAQDLGLEGFQAWFDMEFPTLYHKFQYRQL